jgi:hypothetical protein
MGTLAIMFKELAEEETSYRQIHFEFPKYILEP